MLKFVRRIKSRSVYVEVITRLICIASSFICGLMIVKLSLLDVEIGVGEILVYMAHNENLKRIYKLTKSSPERDSVPFAKMAARFSCSFPSSGFIHQLID